METTPTTRNAHRVTGTMGVETDKNRAYPEAVAEALAGVPRKAPTR